MKINVLLALSDAAFCLVIYNPTEQIAGPWDYPTDLYDVLWLQAHQENVKWRKAKGLMTWLPNACGSSP